MPVETYEIREGQRVDLPSGATSPGAGAQSDAAGTGQTDVPGGTPETPAVAQAAAGAPPAAGQAPSPGEVEGAESDEDPPEAVTLEDFNRHMARLRRRQRSAERALEAERQQHQVELAQIRGQQEAVQRMLSGAAPPLPETPAPPTGPPQAEQYASHEEYVLAAARYGAQQEFQARDQQTQEQRQREQQVQFQQQLIQREQDFQAAHPDFEQVVRTGLAGKVSPILQQALMLVPDGPAVAYTLARQPELVQRLNTLPPPLVLVELGRLSPPPTTPPAHGLPGTATNGSAPSGPAQLPVPLTPLSGSSAGAPTGSYRADMSQQEYRAWRARTSALPEWKNR